MKKSNRQNIAYVTWGETVRCYGLYRSQVLETVSRLARDDPDRDYHLIAAMPVVHSGWVRERHRYFSQVKEARRLLAPAQLHIVPILALQTAVFPTRETFSAIFRGTSLTLSRLLRAHEFDLVHCRSLQATHAMLEARDDMKLDYKVVYDVRSLWPEDMRRRGVGDDDYAFFKTVEKQAVRRADAVVTVEENMEDHMREIGASKTLANYLAADIPDNAVLGGADICSNKNTFHVIYLGAIELEGVHDPRLLFRLFGWIKNEIAGARLTIISTSPHAPLRKLVEVEFADLEAGISYTSFTDRTALLADLPNYHAGLNVHGESKNDNDAIIAKTGFSTKSSEYLGAGLPIICTATSMGIARFINEKDVGLVFEPTANGEDIHREQLLALKTQEVRKRASEFAKKTFSYESSTRRLRALHDELLTYRYGPSH